MHNKYNNEDRLGANSRNALFIISGVKSNIGEVLCINNEVTELLGYDKNEIMGHNISKLMPEMIAAKHSKFVVNYLCSGLFPPMNNRMVLPLHKSGYFIPCTYIHRVFPNMQRGLQIIGFLRKIIDFVEYCPIAETNTTADEVVIMLADDSWNLQAFNYRAAKLFGVDPSKANIRKFMSSEEKINVLSLIPQLSDPTFVTAVKLSSGNEITLNPKMIHKIMEAAIETIGDQTTTQFVTQNSRLQESPEQHSS